MNGTQNIGILFSNPDGLARETLRLLCDEEIRKQHPASPVLSMELPCGEKVEYQEVEDIPFHDVPCPCGDPNHWFVKYEAEKIYNAKEYALSIGFPEDEAETLRNADATNIRRIAVSKGYMADPKGKKVNKMVVVDEFGEALPFGITLAEPCPICGKIHKTGSKIGEEHKQQVRAEAEASARLEAEEEAKRFETPPAE